MGYGGKLRVVAHSHASDGVELGRLADEQAALRRVATLVARGADPSGLFAVVAEQVARVLHVPLVSVVRFEDDGTATERASFSERGPVFPVGKRWSLAGTNVLRRLRATGRPARIDDYSGLEGEIAENVRRVGIRSTVGTPIAVAGRPWGAMVVSSMEPEPLAADTEGRLTDFTELLATAIANTEAQAELARLAEEQAVLRRVATLVAQGVPSGELFAAVIEEVGGLLGADLAGMVRYESDDTVTPVAAWSAAGEHPPLPDRWPIVEGDPAWLVAETRRPARIDDWHGVPGPIAAYIRDDVGIRSSVGGPILVEGRLWGALAVHSRRVGPLPPDTESRLEHFTELVATAIANAHARAEVQRLADEQAALRRVATLVAREAPEHEVLAAVAEEVTRLFGGQATQINRYEADGTATCVASTGAAIPAGTHMTLDGDSVTTRVFRTGTSARIEHYADVEGTFGDSARRAVVQSVVGVPIEVDGRLWGMMGAASRRSDTLPADTEPRMVEFAALVATAISNLQARSDLAASRARIVAAADDERRRVVRDLHDGAQQRLVHTVITLKLADRALEASPDDARPLVKQALGHAEETMVELRELAHGILPAVLVRGGLRAGIDALASRMPVPVEIGVSVDRLAPAVEATAYFVVAEALTNVAKHSSADHVEVTTRIEDRALRVDVRDDGRGGAQAYGTGLLGLADRLAALDGRLEVESPPGSGTHIAATIPLP
jgi:signal transduction histidine kinase